MSSHARQGLQAHQLHAFQRYLLIVGDAHTASGQKAPALEVAKFRLNRRLWPIYENTRNRKSIASGDICLVYLAGSGPNAQTVLCEFVVEELRTSSRRSLVIDRDEFLVPEAVLAIVLKEVRYFNPPIDVRSKLDKLSFIGANRDKWGMAFHGGCRKLSDEDYSVLVS